MDRVIRLRGFGRDLGGKVFVNLFQVGWQGWREIMDVKVSQPEVAIQRGGEDLRNV
jgi:hypothetical protein